MSTSLFINIAADFSFRSTVYSHGWSELAPFALDSEVWRLRYVFADARGGIEAAICEDNGRIRIDLAAEPAEPERIIAQTRHILRLDDDLSDFYGILDGHKRLGWVNENKAGRLLRSPTVWEDLVKTICTTNCSWALTKIMVRNLVEKLGEPTSEPGAIATGSAVHTPTRRSNRNPVAIAPGSDRAFPTPAAMAAIDEEYYRNEIRAGYRSPYFIELAERVASGELDPEAWLTSDLPTPELKKEMKKVKGVGDYAAENLLKLVGRYDGLALDSWLRSQFYKNHNKEKKCPDKKIERHYKKYREWAGLVIWCDMTEKWIVE